MNNQIILSRFPLPRGYQIKQIDKTFYFDHKGVAYGPYNSYYHAKEAVLADFKKYIQNATG